MSAEWTRLKIQDIGEVKSGKRLPLGHSLVDVVTPYPYIRLVDVSDGSVQRNDLQFLKSETRACIKRYVVNTADVCLAIVGHTIGVVFYIDAQWDDVNLTENAARITDVHASVNSRYLYYFLVSPTGQAEIISRKVGSAQGKLPLYNIKSLEVTFPPRKQQDEIVAILDAMSSRITLLRETNATLEAIAQALFKSWFVDFDPVRAKLEGRAPEGMDEATARLFPDNFEESELGLVPRGWRIGTLADLAEFQNGYAFKSKDWVESGHPVVKIGDVKPGIIDFSGCSFVAPETTVGLERFQLNRGDLLVGMTGYVGETGLVAEVAPPAYLNQRVGRIATSDGMKDGGFVYCLVRAAEFKAYAVAQSHGSAQANVSGSALLNYTSIIPSADVQAQFNDLTNPILEKILSNHEQAQTLATLRDTLLPRLISGQLRLPVKSDQTGECNGV
jgi:type I restriction enzyme, S subunit